MVGYKSSETPATFYKIAPLLAPRLGESVAKYNTYLDSYDLYLQKVQALKVSAKADLKIKDAVRKGRKLTRVDGSVAMPVREKVPNPAYPRAQKAFDAVRYGRSAGDGSGHVIQSTPKKIEEAKAVLEKTPQFVYRDEMKNVPVYLFQVRSEIKVEAPASEEEVKAKAEAKKAAKAAKNRRAKRARSLRRRNAKVEDLASQIKLAETKLAAKQVQSRLAKSLGKAPKVAGVGDEPAAVQSTLPKGNARARRRAKRIARRGPATGKR
jgi:hypothetical protein